MASSNFKKKPLVKDKDPSGVFISWTKLIIVLVVMVLIVFALIGSIIYLLVRNQPLETQVSCASVEAVETPGSSVDSTTGQPGQPVQTGAGGTGSEAGTTTTLPTTTTKLVYPAITPVARVPLVSFHSTTFDIVSATLELHIVRTPSSFMSSSAKVIYELNIKSTTKVIQLRSAVKSIAAIEVTDSKGKLIGNIKDKKYDEISQILTLNLPSPISSGIIKVDLSYAISEEAFEMTSLPYDQTTCSFFILRKLCYLVPHFEYFVKHTWKIQVVQHPTNVVVLSNSFLSIPAMEKPRREPPNSSVFWKSLPLIPGEVSFVLVENYPISREARRLNVISIWTNETKDDEISNLAAILKAHMKSITPSLKETICFVVVPGMESYEFIGKNVAFIGTGLLRSKMEIIDNFAWIWVFRLILYQKAITLDKNPIWIYEQSAVFLASTTKSNHRNVWNKYNYEMAMDSGRSGIEGPSNKSIVYEDEQRYFEKPGHSAKVFTVLGMVTSIGGFVADDLMTNMINGRDNTSGRFFFMKSQLNLGNGEKLDVDGMTSCYIDSSGIPGVHFSRVDKSHVAVQRTDVGQTNRCDMPLWLVNGKNNTNATNKEHKLLTDKVEKVQVEADSVVVLSGDSPFSAYGYTMDQTELDKLLDDSFDVASYDNSALNLLASNVVRAAAEGKLSYESVYGLLRKLLQGMVVGVDDVVDLWMWTVSQSRNDTLLSLTEAIVASVLNSEGSASDTASVVAYITNRFDNSLTSTPFFEIEKAKDLIQKCGSSCYSSINYASKVDCVFGSDKDCLYDPHVLEVHVCKTINEVHLLDYGKCYDLFVNCAGKPCLLPAFKGLLCSKETTRIESWLKHTMTLDTTDLINRQVIMAIYEGLASNVVYRPLMFPYFLENWHLLHEKYSKYPALLGNIIDTLASTIVTREQLLQFEQFVAFYGDSLNVFREFKDHIIRARKAVEWNAKFSQVFTNLFQNP